MATQIRVLPPCCFKCGGPLNDVQARYEQLLREGVPIGAALDSVGLKRRCCRIAMMTPAAEPRANYVAPERLTFAPVFTSTAEPPVYSLEGGKNVPAPPSDDDDEGDML